MRGLLLLSLLLSLAGCMHESSGADRAPVDWKSQVGREVTLEGAAVSSKSGPILRTGDHWIYADLSDWPPDAAGKRIRVRGIVEERWDLPVFVEDPAHPAAVAGIPVPPGTDLHAASHRFLLTNVRIEEVVR